MGMVDGKVAVITGATSGIGAKMAEVFVAEGAKVVIAGRRAVPGQQLAKQLGSVAQFIQVDVAKESDVKAMVDGAVARFGRLDCLVNNAGIPGPLCGIAELDMAEYDAAMSVLLRSVFLGIKHVAPVMIKQGQGSIINVASVAGNRTGYGGQTYSAAKAAVIHLTRCTAMELGEKNVRVNSISPGAIVTGIFGKAFGVSDDAADRTAAFSRTTSRSFSPFHAQAGPWTSPRPPYGLRVMHQAS
jgi:NAD(P)-dependent dehydrogenase (short-subunit alcohol dehydrogenase family)